MSELPCQYKDKLECVPSEECAFELVDANLLAFEHCDMLKLRQ